MMSDLMKQKINLISIFVLTLMITAVLAPQAFGKCDQTMIDVQILGINDFHGQITEGAFVAGRPVGSAPVLASYLKAASMGMETQTLIVHAGDIVGASPPESALLQDEPTIMFFNLMANKYCSTESRMHPKCNIVGTVGNHEFDDGQEEMLRLLNGGNHDNGPFLQDPWQGANFPHVCANVVYEETGRPILPPYVIKNVKGVHIAFIGAVLKETATIVTAEGIAGLAFQDEAEAINTQVRLLKDRGVKSIIAVIHEGGYQTSYDGPTDPDQTDLTGAIVDIVKALDSEVDVVLSGHSHGFTNALIENNEGADILVAQAWSKGTAYADVDLQIDRHTRDVVSKTAKIVTTWADEGPGLEPDAQVLQLVDQAIMTTGPLTGQVVAEAAADIMSTQNAAGESALGNLIADAQRTIMDSDFAFMNPGGIRSDLLAGAVTWGDLYTIQPFNNYLIKIELTGQQIYDLLNQQFTPYQPYDRMLQVSGLTYTWDASRPANDLIVEVRKEGDPIDAAGVYTVTVNSFLAGGGDQFTVLPEGTVMEVGPIDLDALIEYIQNLPQPITYAIDGRIERVN